MKAVINRWSALLLLGVAMPVFAQDDTEAAQPAVQQPLQQPGQQPGQQPEQPPAPQPCSTRNHRQFDFWIGEWNVTSGDQHAGTNSIEVILDGCALQENWQGAGQPGLTGTSFNIYDQANDKWHQTWVDNTGTLLELDGGMAGGTMVLSGRRPSQDGSSMVTHRITWTPNRDGSVRQLWEASGNGKEWTVLFDGLYQRTSGVQ